MPLIALSLTGCSTVGQGKDPNDSAPEIASTPTGSIELLPAPTVAATSAPVAKEGSTPAVVPTLPTDWVQESYGDAWTIGYPTNWTVNAAGAHEGSLQLQGEYKGHSYLLNLSYPIGVFPKTLEEWVDEMLLPLSLHQHSKVLIHDVAVGATPAKKVLNVVTPDGLSLTHYVYIWRSETKSPRLIALTQNDGLPHDSMATEQLLDLLLAFVE